MDHVADVRGMINGMTKRKIAITISEQHLADAKRAVAEGRARSVSAYVDEALAARGEPRGLALYVESLIQRFGEPSAEARAWAAEQLDAPGRNLEHSRRT